METTASAGRSESFTTSHTSHRRCRQLVPFQVQYRLYFFQFIFIYFFTTYLNKNFVLQIKFYSIQYSRSSDEVLHILSNILGALQRGRTALVIPKKKPIDELMKSRNMVYYTRQFHA